MRFCTSCQVSRQEEGGEFRRLRSTARWVCQCCLQRNTHSIYSSRGTTTAGDIRRLVNKLQGRVA
jgi:hypothetical protein